jgi:hypothetical protein
MSILASAFPDGGDFISSSMDSVANENGTARLWPFPYEARGSGSHQYRADRYGTAEHLTYFSSATVCHIYAADTSTCQCQAPEFAQNGDLR